MAKLSPVLRNVVVLGVVAATPLALAACTDKSAGDGAITVNSTDDACELSSTDLQTGQVNFEITNAGDKVTEFYVYGKNNRVLAEVENIGPGLKGKLGVEITEPGTYTVACKPGMVGQGIRQEIKVTGDTKAKSQAPADVEAAKARYLDYVRGQLNGFLAQTETFTGDVKNGNLDKARREFGLVRTFYERIEPVAESFPELDPKIDMRWDDTEDGKQPFTGFHRIERFLFPPQASQVGEAGGQVAPSDAADAKTADTKANIDTVADQLLTDVKALKAEIDAKDFQFETQMFVHGAQALIDEIAKTKVGGEEDRYSHTDLWDIAANIEGSQALISQLEAIITKRDPNLIEKINTQFAEVSKDIDQFREGDGYLSYDKVTPEQRKALSDKVDALSATLSMVPGAVMAK